MPRHSLLGAMVVVSSLLVDLVIGIDFSIVFFGWIWWSHAKQWECPSSKRIIPLVVSQLGHGPRLTSLLLLIIFDASNHGLKFSPSYLHVLHSLCIRRCVRVVWLPVSRALLSIEFALYPSNFFSHTNCSVLLCDTTWSHAYRTTRSTAYYFSSY